MKKKILFFVAYWSALVVLMMAFKALFMLVEPAYSGLMGQIFGVIGAGFSMDLSMSAYLLAPAALWLIAYVWCTRPFMLTILRVYTWIVSGILAVVTVVDAMLYPYWGFRLEATPIFYFTSSPKAALASIPWWQTALGVVGIIVLAIGIYVFLSLTFRILIPGKSSIEKERTRNIIVEGQSGSKKSIAKRILATVVLTVMTGLLIIPIRGGVTVSTMAPGRAYFSENMTLNQAAVNPLFNLMYSLTHIDRLAEQFNFYDPSEAEKIVAEFVRPGHSEENDTFASVGDNDTIAYRAVSDGDRQYFDRPESRVSLAESRPDIYLIILESFSAHLMPSLGGEPVALCLDRIAGEGVSFTNFYAESFRTDRGLATILSGYPALPTTSVFRYADKFGNMPSLARELRKAGYSANYYYGGDINFTNQQGYLRATGFSHVVSDVDFPISRRISKWGAHDADVYNRVLEEKLTEKTPVAPSFNVIQTSSSHEPFEVPYHRLADKRANAFAYADSCLGAFVDRLRESDRWSNTLVVIVPDHWGAYPQETAPMARHHVPLVMTGGALRGLPARISVPGSQSAIAPTVLAIMGLDFSMFPHSRNLLSYSSAGQYAWFTEPEWYALLLPGEKEATVVEVSESGHPAKKQDAAALRRARAFVQTIYDDLNER